MFGYFAYLSDLHIYLLQKKYIIRLEVLEITNSPTFLT
jgi:hypothetical protein